jgi:hypothetical protein
MDGRCITNLGPDTDEKPVHCVFVHIVNVVGTYAEPSS